MKYVKAIYKQLGAYKYVLLVIAVGLVLLLWPNAPPETGVASAVEASLDNTDGLESRLEEVLAKTEGVGRVSVLLTRKSDIETQYAYETSGRERKEWDNGTLSQSETDTSSSIVMSGDSAGGEQPVVKSRTYPVYQGALIVCDGAANAEVRLKVAEAVAALTNLGYDKITVVKMKTQ